MAALDRTSRVFKLRTFKTAPELIPVAMLPLTVVTLGFAYIAYGLSTKPDVIINKYNSLPPWEKVNPERSIKVLRVGQEYKSIPELEQLKRNSVTDK
ncbi:hypothetical protein LSH36_2200g00003 [Paralvinella palmiformis]|uniref:Uncharacterized protein n=1 Tax=Paralvinella palmiformis TaxID=53620 RepID=A0AAD9MKQ0_9ANNE|nr:hypothetical protein LSH36_2200g00003 [Paralvinella palmiformis]